MNTGELERAASGSCPSRLSAGKRILLIEDDPHVAETFAELLELEGYRVMVVHDAAAGLDAVRRNLTDVVLCDLTLHGPMDGFDFARACRADPDLCGLHLLAVSGYDRPEDRLRAQSAGFDELIGKPVDINRVHVVINEGRT